MGASALPVALLCLCLCSTALANRTAFWANSVANKISHAPLIEEGMGADIPIDPSYLNIPRGVAVDSAAGKVYWLNTGNGGSIGYANLDGSAAGFLNTAGASFTEPSGLAIDPARGRIYWGNAGGGSIGYANLNGSGGGQIAITGATAEPNGLTVDPLNGRIYWSNFVADKISYANLDGSAPHDLDTSGAPVDGPIGVAIISHTSRIYWANREGDSIGYANLDGGGGGNADLNLAILNPAGIATDGGTLFWASEERDEIRDGNLAGCCTVSLETQGATQSGVSPPVLLESPRTAGIGIPTVSGMHKPGSTLTCSPLEWQGDAIESFLYRTPQSISYQWMRDKQPIAGATSQTLAATKVGNYVCRVTATNFAGANTEESLHRFQVKATVGFKKVRFNRRKGTATLRVAVTGTGRLDLYGNGVTNAQRKHATGTTKLIVKTSGKARIKLTKTGRAKVKATISYTPEGGKAIKRFKKIVLKKKLKR
jgi:hypothetical protein